MNGNNLKIQSNKFYNLLVLCVFFSLPLFLYKFVIICALPCSIKNANRNVDTKFLTLRNAAMNWLRFFFCCLCFVSFVIQFYIQGGSLAAVVMQVEFSVFQYSDRKWKLTLNNLRIPNKRTKGIEKKNWSFKRKAFTHNICFLFVVVRLHAFWYCE